MYVYTQDEELTRYPNSGEKTAQTLESNLTSLEQKLDDLLKSFENSEAAKKLDAQTEAKHDDRGNGKGKGGGEVNGEDGKA